MKTNMLVLILCPLMLTGCAAVSGGAGGKVCNSISSVTTITPTSAAADHAAGTPGNQVQFMATTVTTYPKECAIPTFIVAPYQTQWASSDTIDAPIDSAPGASTNGVAVCKNATLSPVTISVAGTSATAKLTCN